MNPHEPSWQSDAEPRVRRARDAYRRAGPSADQLEAMLARLEVHTFDPATAAPSPRPTLPALRLVKVGVLLGALGGAALLARNPAEHAPEPVAAPSAVTVGALPAVPVPEAEPAPDPSVDTAPSGARDTPTAAPESPKQRGHGRARSGAPRDTVQAADPLAELALLTRARRISLAQPARALALLEQHRAQYPHGTLAEERELLAVEALLREGREAEARTRAGAFRAEHPRSLHVRRLDALFIR